MRRSRLILLSLAVGLAGFAAAAVAAYYLWPPTQPAASASAVRSTGKALVGGPFSLIDHTGKPRSDRDFRGRLMLVFFGFTHCPDVCPTTLQTATEALEKLGSDADKVQVVFISVDPERDTPAQLKRYHAAFDPRIVMLTGSTAEIAKVAKAYRVYYAKRPADRDGNYAVDHSAFSYLMARDGRYLTHFSHKAPPDRLAKAIRERL